MERPGTGRRRVRSGAVRATELINRALVDRAGRRVGRPASHAADDAPTTELAAVVDEEPDEGRSPVSRVAKAAGLALAALTLCATVGAAVAVSRERAEGARVDLVGPITGKRALLPDELSDAVTGTATATRPRPTPSTAPTTTTTRVAVVGGAPATGSGDGTLPAADSPQPPSTAGLTDQELVAEYYRLVLNDPADAFALLSGTEFGADLGHFIASWAGVAEVKVGDISRVAEGVQADVRLVLGTGQTLWVRQLFHVTETTPHRIANVTLLSAQVS